MATGCSSAPEPKPGRAPGTLRVAIRRPSTLDPALLRDPSGLLIARQVFEPLVGYNPKTLQLQPALAKSWETLDGGARFIFHLRDAYFHNGKPVTAEDVRFSLNRLARKDTGSEVSFLVDAIAGFEAVNQQGTAAEMEGLKAIDNKTLEVRLKEPWFDFPYTLTHPSSSPIPRAELEADPARFKEAPVGAGPYRLLGPAKQGQDIQLERFRKYWGPPPAIKSVRLLLYEQMSGAWQDFEKGKLDITEVPPGQMLSARTRFGTKGFGPIAAGIYVGFNLKKVPDVRIRQAVSLAIDRRQIARNVYEETLLPAPGLVPRGLPGRNAVACPSLCERDTERAKALVKEASPAAAPVIAYQYQAGAANDAMAKSIQSNLAEAGITLNLQPLELTQYFDTLDQESQETFRIGWVAEYPLADWFLTPLFRSGSTDNHTGYANPAVDALLRKGRADPSRAARLASYREAETAILNDMPLIPIGFFRNHYAANARVRSFYVDELGAFSISKLKTG